MPTGPAEEPASEGPSFGTLRYDGPRSDEPGSEARQLIISDNSTGVPMTAKGAARKKTFMLWGLAP